jgi:LysM repeat protein
MTAMNSLRFTLLPVVAFGIVSCASKADPDSAYETSNPYGAQQYVNPATPGDTGATQAPGSAPAQPMANPVYDTPAAYEENTGGRKAPPAADSAIVDPGVAPGAPKPPPHKPGTNAPAANPSAEATNVALSGTIHTVGKGDSLWAIGKKYGVSVESLKKANGLTKDTVVIGQKLQIPVR